MAVVELTADHQVLLEAIDPCLLPAALHATLNEADAPVHFASISWQALLPLLPLDAAAATWASETHGLQPATDS